MFDTGQPIKWRRRAVAWLVGRSRYEKRAILMVADGLLFYAALWAALAIRYGELYTPPTWRHLLLICAAPVIAVAVLFRLGLYRVVTRYFSADTLAVVLTASGIAGLLWALAVQLSGLGGIPRSVIVFYPLAGALLVWSMRTAAQALLGHPKDGASRQLPPRNAKRVVIYGAGTTGVQLLEALRQSGQYAPVGFVDSDPSLWRQQVSGLKVHAPDRLQRLVREHDVKEVLLAMPRVQRRERRNALQQLERLPVAVRTLPAIEDLASGRVAVSDLREIDPQDLLGREPVPPNPELLARNIKGKSVLVTGAGGSIGSELVRAVLRQKPRRLILLDRGEEQLYRISTEVEDLLRRRPANGSPNGSDAARPEVRSVLGSVLDASLMRRTIAAGEVETVYHAAAFKHVPMLEHNAAEAIRNNTFGTLVLADAAAELGVERFVLVSTDKAVRPTSVMGASKRLAEMILQARAFEEKSDTVFTMVRFGNVLDSSGSVVRRFREQIRAGGPITVTHPDVIRYFMSIPEAAALVIQAGAMAEGGDVFVLDMGEPVRIADLARSMLRLAGLEVRDAEQPDGDIAIEYIGLRAGEKLHEELLLNESAVATEHPSIRKSHEPFLPPDELAAALDDLQAALQKGDAAIRAVLSRAVEGFPASAPPCAASHPRDPRGLSPPQRPAADALRPAMTQRPIRQVPTGYRRCGS